MKYLTFGRHIAVDAWGIDFSILDNVDLLQQKMIAAAEECQATVLSVTSKKFEPNGCTVLVLLSESHCSIHTYPEEGFAAIDCYTCGEKADPRLAIHYLIEELKPAKIYTKTLIRGLQEIIIVD